LSCSSGCSCSGSRRLSLGTAALTYVLAVSSLSYDQAFQLLATRVFGVVSNNVLIGIALFVLYGRLCAEMSVRPRLAAALTGLFGHRAALATTAEVTTSLVQPDGQSAGLAFLQAITPPGVSLIILGDLFGVSIAQLFLGFAPFAILVGLLLQLMAAPAGASGMRAAATSEIEAGSLSWIAVLFIVLGVIGLGYATPPEPGALAVALALIFGVTQRQLSGQIGHSLGGWHARRRPQVAVARHGSTAGRNPARSTRPITGYACVRPRPLPRRSMGRGF
jgi:TRAP-type mannitol/chloroaromatic compound transport system permease large subunit